MQISDADHKLWHWNLLLEAMRLSECLLLWLWQEELKSTTVKMAEESKVLNTPGAEKQTEQKLFDALRQELELYSSHLSYFDITFLASFRSDEIT